MYIPRQFQGRGKGLYALIIHGISNNEGINIVNEMKIKWNAKHKPSYRENIVSKTAKVDRQTGPLIKLLKRVLAYFVELLSDNQQMYMRSSL